MTLGFLSGSKNFCKLLWVSCEVFVLHGYAWIHRVAKSCTTTAYRWLFRDSQVSLCSAVIKSPKLSARGTAPKLRLSWMLGLNTLHWKNWRESLHVQEFHHPPNLLKILEATPGSQNLTGLSVLSTTGLPVLSVALFDFVFGVLLTWSTSDLADLSSTVADTVTKEMSLSIRFSRSRVLVSLTVGGEEELEEDVERWLSCLESVLEVDESDPEDEFADKPGTTIGTKFSVLHCKRIPFWMRCGFWPLIHS